MKAFNRIASRTIRGGVGPSYMNNYHRRNLLQLQKIRCEWNSSSSKSGRSSEEDTWSNASKSLNWKTHEVVVLAIGFYIFGSTSVGKKSTGDGEPTYGSPEELDTVSTPLLFVLSYLSACD